ncbi:protein-methionine-sulfoxide reductase catalytic subunit MsrP [Shewanella sp. NIFS-20-20]|uniref:protein-methionine-sulfoxide reductase catalytic subunit MsrP n=1 Tax=Shewanella sp. NIFS-20-20 TaxID=2853806 RepID=UPI001C43D3AA|nr:protein-methionine-sulfoxide reductase catalytic subunit MsrP [Shewanella sp. NIFS-20-20]MBV7315071.1 protein-methionine-sulfoxide reductase catalytic subunit MsrP [Shewanella sp. NIFS-20-20]
MMSHNKFRSGIVTRATWQEKESNVTPQSVFKQRRQIIQALGLGAIATSIPGAVHAGIFDVFDSAPPTQALQPLQYVKSPNAEDQILTPFDKVTSHNNFYEFGTAKSDPAENSQQFNTKPWQLVIDGEVDKPVTIDIDDLMARFPLEERIYRLRCVEAWSMVIPWIGIPLASILRMVAPNSQAKYVAFETLFDPEQMPGQKHRLMGGGIQYPYVEGLTIAEAMNPLTLLSVGLYGKTLPPQNGAPIRLVVPWKYGFKSIKSIVRIRLTSTQPPTTWSQLAANEYGFFANVNPMVDHPRWSQATERRIDAGGLFSARRIETQMFNGYGEQVADLYSNIDLKRFY